METDPTTNQTFNSSNCIFIDTDSRLFITYMDFFNRVIMPGVLMIIFTILLFYYVIKSRSISNSTLKSKRIYRDLKLSITILSFNLFYMVLQLPLTIVYILIPDYYTNIYYIFACYIFYSSYAFNFYILLFTNSLIRNELLLWFSVESNTKFEKNTQIKVKEINFG